MQLIFDKYDKAIDKKRLKDKLDRLKGEGVMQVGFAEAVFDSPDIDWRYVMHHIIPELLDSGMLSKESRGVAPYLILDEYLERLDDLEEFALIEKYFFN